MSYNHEVENRYADIIRAAATVDLKGTLAAVEKSQASFVRAHPDQTCPKCKDTVKFHGNLLDMGYGQRWICEGCNCWFSANWFES